VKVNVTDLKNLTNAVFAVVKVSIGKEENVTVKDKKLVAMVFVDPQMTFVEMFAVSVEEKELDLI